MNRVDNATSNFIKTFKQDTNLYEFLKRTADPARGPPSSKVLLQTYKDSVQDKENSVFKVATKLDEK